MSRLSFHLKFFFTFSSTSNVAVSSKIASIIRSLPILDEYRLHVVASANNAVIIYDHNGNHLNCDDISNMIEQTVLFLCIICDVDRNQIPNNDKEFFL